MTSHKLGIDLSAFEVSTRGSSCVGWWSALALARDAHFDQGLDVVVKQIGGLGCYSRSQLPGIPHATTEHIHTWGFGGKRKA